MVRTQQRLRRPGRGVTVINEFIVYNRSAIEALKPHEVPHIIVSIRSPKDPQEARLPTGKHTLGVCRLTFHDMDDAHMAYPAIKKEYETECFSRSQARQIIDLVRANPDAQRLLVHCDAGFSRSPAVAAALSKAITGDDKAFFKRYSPNMRVYRTLLEEFMATAGAIEHGNDDHRDQGR